MACFRTWHENVKRVKEALLLAWTECLYKRGHQDMFTRIVWYCCTWKCHTSFILCEVCVSCLFTCYYQMPSLMVMYIKLWWNHTTTRTMMWCADLVSDSYHWCYQHSEVWPVQCTDHADSPVFWTCILSHHSQWQQLKSKPNWPQIRFW